ncbi:MAG: histidine kinase [Oscillospiraceae bacterium]|jgi:signal transduction histidine kinase|nr:histidine kinase [Oscillospiraceae bacterium]
MSLHKHAIAARAAGGMMLVVCWGLLDGPLLCIPLLAWLTATSIVRYRFGPYGWLAPAEALLCAAAGFWWPYALLGLWFPILSLLENEWTRREASLREESDENRAYRLQLEQSRSALLTESAQAAALAENAERARIAQDLHDHAGHEITGALLALQTAERLLSAGRADEAKALLPQIIERMDNAASQMRDTVHNLKPDYAPDADMLRGLCARFAFCPADFTAYGDMSAVTGTQWQLLLAVLKEALTNVSRHSGADRVSVRLDCGPRHVRLAVIDNGTPPGKTAAPGLGLSGMRDRARAAGGTFTAFYDKGFRIFCVLPLGGTDETADR